MAAPVELIVLAFAAFRLTRLLVEDSITDSLRDWVAVRSPFVSRLLDCYWCAGFYCCGLVVIMWELWPTVAYPILLVFALSAAVGILSELMDRLIYPRSSDDG